MPVTGLPMTLGRSYDSLDRGRSGDLGYGWSLSLGHPRLEVSPTHDVTLTPASDGDSGVDVAGGAARVTTAGTGALLASADSDTAAVGGPLALTDIDRHVLLTDAARLRRTPLID